MSFLFRIRQGCLFAVFVFCGCPCSCILFLCFPFFVVSLLLAVNLKLQLIELISNCLIATFSIQKQPFLLISKGLMLIRIWFVRALILLFSFCSFVVICFFLQLE